jgi:hypothetical protein
MNIELLGPDGTILGKVVFYQEFNENWTKKNNDIDVFISTTSFKITGDEEGANLKTSILNRYPIKNM